MEVESAVKIVCIGDSLTQGYGLDTRDRWTNLLEDKVKIEIINSGISGDTTSGMLARFKSMVIDYAPSHVIIMGGTNDLLMNLSYEHIIANILSMTRHARHTEIEAIIGIPTLAYENKDMDDFSIFISMDMLSQRIDVLRDKLVKFCTEDGLSYIDFAEHLDKDDYQDDRLHPNESGNIKMMNNALGTVNKIVKRNISE